MLLQRGVVLLCLIAFAIPVNCSFAETLRDIWCAIPWCSERVVPPMEYGYHVSIRFDGEHHCSGSIIEDRYILTSYSCILTYGFRSDGEKKQVTVVAGTNSLKSGGDKYVIEKTIEPYEKTDDIALLQTRNEIKFHKGIRKIEIADYNTFNDDASLRITAWKHSPISGTEGDGLLKSYPLRLYGKVACWSRYCWNKKPKMCTYDQTKQGLCHTDAGGGIVANEKLIGIHSNKEECYDGGEPKSHTPVSPYKDWIRELILRNSEPVPVHGGEIHEVDDAATGAFPYHVIISLNNIEHICSGAIINERHILTSHYCIMRYNAHELTVKAGVHWLTEQGKSYRVQMITASDDYDYDFAILRTTERIDFNKFVKSIPIIKCSDALHDNQSITLIGYERPIIDRATSIKLKQIPFKVYNREKCMGVIPFLNDAYMCSITSSSERACNMDYGSPIVADGRLVAMNPFGVKCADNKKLHVHLPLHKYSSWIQSKTRL